MKLSRLTTTALLAALALPTIAIGETLKLTNGDVITVTILSQNEESYTVLHPDLGEVTIAKAKVAAVYEDAEAFDAAEKAAAAKAAAEAKAAEREADQGIFFGSGFLAGWNRRVELGLSGAQGNSTNSNIRAAFHGDYQDEEDRWIFDMVYRRSDSEGDKTEDRFTAELTKDWLIPDEKYFYFVNGKFESDRFEAWDQRLSGFLGSGYQFYQDDTWDLLGRVGVGGNQTYGAADDEFTAEALLGIKAEYQIADNQSLAFANTLYPSLEEGGEFRNITTLDWIISINRDKGLSLKLGVANEHDSNVPAGTKKNDFTYYASLLWEF